MLKILKIAALEVELFQPEVYSINTLINLIIITKTYQSQNLN